MRIIDRYVVREIIPPFLIALLVFTFLLIIPFIIELAEEMIAKGVPAGTILQLASTLLPSSMALTVPMALLIGLLVGLGRISADREFMVMMACGISPYRLLQPVLVFAVVCWGATSWLMLKGMPDGNQKYREISNEIVMDRAEGEVRERVFYEDFPNVVLYVHEVPLDGRGWLDVLAADTRNPSEPVIYLAKRGRMAIDREARTIHMVLEEGTRHTTKLEDRAAYEVVQFESTIIALDPETVFPRTGPQRGLRELAVEDLAAVAAELQHGGQSPHGPIMEIHKKFSVPVACFVFAVIGVALGASHRKDGKLAAFVLGIGVIFVYYVIMFMAESLTKGFWIPAWLAMWIPNVRARRRGPVSAGAARPIGGPADSHCPARLRSLRELRRGKPAPGSWLPDPRPEAGAGHPHPAFHDAGADAARRLHRAAVRPHPGHDHRRPARALLHLVVHRQVRQVVQGAGRRPAWCWNSCSGRHRSG